VIAEGATTMKNIPPMFEGLERRDKRDKRLTTAIAYCANCNRWVPVNLKLTGYRFDCPRWDLNKIHVAAVIGNRWSQATWVKLIASLERYQAWRSHTLGKWCLLIALILSAALFWSSSPLAHHGAGLIGLILTVDVMLFTSANALASQRPRFAPRSIIAAMAGFAQLCIGFALLHAGLGFDFQVGQYLKPLDFRRALYFSVVTLSTVGYGDITPPNDPSQPVFWIVIAQILCGLYYLAVFVSTTVSWVRGIQRPPTLKDLLVESDELDKQDVEQLAQQNTPL
jgi:hypothetical protein